MFDIGGGELLLILIFVLIAFGPKKLPELAQSLGRGMREFKRAQREFTEQINSAIEHEQRKKYQAPVSHPEGVVPYQPATPAIGEGAGAENTIQPPAMQPPTSADPAPIVDNTVSRSTPIGDIEPGTNGQMGIFPDEPRQNGKDS